MKHKNERVSDARQSFDLLSAVLFINAVLTYLLIVLGSTVRVTNSGTGCPSWPLCYGKATPIFGNSHALIEQSHRYLASVVSILVFISLILVYRLKDKARKHFLIKIAYIAVGEIIVQVILGAVTVITKNAPWTVFAHLLIASIFLGTMIVYFLASHSLDCKWYFPKKPIKTVAYLSLIFTFLTVTFGSLIVNGDAEQNCNSWPLCPTGEPTKDVVLNLIHRTVVGLTVLFYLVFAYIGTKYYKRTSWWIKSIALLIGVIFITAVFGAISALTKAQPVFQDIHLSLAALDWVVVVTLVAQTHLKYHRDLQIENTEESNQIFVSS